MRRIFPIVLLLCSLSRPLWAQASIQAQVDRDTITVQDVLRLTITIKGGSALTTPEIPARGNFEVVGRSSGNSIEIINGSMSVTSTFEYMLKPTQAGKFFIGPIVTHIEGQAYSAGPIQVTVMDAGRGPGPPNLPPPSPSPFPGAPPITPGYPPGPPPQWPYGENQPQPNQRADTFVTAEVDKKTAYVGEQVLFTFRLYSAVSLTNARLKLPEFKQFISEELIKEHKFETTLEGRRYAVNEVRLALFPTKAGKISTGKATVEASVPTAIRFDSQDPFNDPFFQRMQRMQMMGTLENKAFSSDNLEIEVKELPAPPNNFSGLVGEFTLESKLDPGQLAVGETAQYNVTLAGKGNIREGQFAKVIDSPFFKVYPGTPKVEEDKTMQGVGGKKTFNYALVASRPGSTQVGPYTMSYFNPKTGSYESLTAPNQALQITGSNAQENLVSAGIDKRDAHPLAMADHGRLFQGIQEIPAVLTRSIPTTAASVFWWALLVIPPGAYLTLDLVRRGQRRREALSEDRKRSRAFRKAKGALADLPKFSEKNSSSKISGILREYLSDAFLIKGGALTPSEVETLLAGKKIPADTIRRMVYLLEELDSWKYGGADQGMPEESQLKEEIIDLLKEIEKSL